VALSKGSDGWMVLDFDGVSMEVSWDFYWGFYGGFSWDIDGTLLVIFMGFAIGIRRNLPVLEI